jgi:ribose-phosphate pyrophosphokinase
MGLQDLCVVSPDAGGVERARAYAKRLGATLAIVDKRRETANVAEVHNVIGDVAGKTVLIVDDLVDTAGTLCKVAEALGDAGAGKILASASHAVLSGNAVKNINASRISQLIVTDSIEERPEKKSDKIVVLPIGELMGKAVQNIHEEASVTSLFI